jgi:hypothetical protein
VLLLPLFPSLYVEVRYADILKTRQLPAVDTYNYYYIFQEFQIQNIYFPNVVDIIDGIWISGEAFSEGPMQRICILCHQPRLYLTRRFLLNFVRLLGA